MMSGHFNLIASGQGFFYGRGMQRFLLICFMRGAGRLRLDGRRMDKIEIGMSREEVIKIMGKPESTMQSLQGEILRYQLNESINDWMPATYYIYIANGKVKQYRSHGGPARRQVIVHLLGVKR